jgi:hypothetical protein
MAQIDFGLLNQNAPQQVGASFDQGRRNALAMQLAQQQQEQNALGMGRMQEETMQRNALRTALQQSGGDLAGVSQGMLQAGDLGSYAKVEALKQHQQDQGIKLLPQIAQLLHADPSDANVDVLAGVYRQATGQDVSQFAQQLKGMPPEQRQQVAMRLAQKAQDMKYQMFQHGNQVVGAGIDPNTGQMTQTGSIPLPESPLDAARAKYYEAQSGRKEQPPAPMGYQWTEDGRQAPIAGGPADPTNPLNKSKGVTGGKVLPAGQLESLADMKRVRDTLAGVGESLAKTPVETGPYAGRKQALQSKVGMADDSFVDLQQKFSTAENIMLKLRSGAAVTDQEYERFKKEFPTVNDPEDVRDRKLKNAVNYATDLLDEKIGLYEEGGYKVPERVLSPSAKVAREAETQPGSGPKAGDIVKGYKFKGGNPADKNNWEKQ